MSFAHALSRIMTPEIIPPRGQGADCRDTDGSHDQNPSVSCDVRCLFDALLLLVVFGQRLLILWLGPLNSRLAIDNAGDPSTPLPLSLLR